MLFRKRKLKLYSDINDNDFMIKLDDKDEFAKLKPIFTDQY